ncbi:MAG: DoxX family protein [Candidatus Sericytochromatia bacterium]
MQSHEQIASSKNFERNILWVLATTFIISGLLKFSGSPLLSESFVNWGYPAAFVYLVGVVELAGGLLLLNRHSAFFGGIILALEMFAAFFTHFVHGEAIVAIVPLALMSMLILVAREHSTEIVNQVAGLLNWYEHDHQGAGSSRH